MIPGDQFYCDADVEWTAEQLAAMADLYPPGEHLTGFVPPEHLAGFVPAEHLIGLMPGKHLAELAEEADGEEPEPPGAAGAELTRRLLALAPALEAADREAARREEEERQRREEEERGPAELLLAVGRPVNGESHAGCDSEPGPGAESESERLHQMAAETPSAATVAEAATAVATAAPSGTAAATSAGTATPGTAAAAAGAAPADESAPGSAGEPLKVRVVRGAGVSPREVEVVVLETPEGDTSDRQAESAC